MNRHQLNSRIRAINIGICVEVAQCPFQTSDIFDIAIAFDFRQSRKVRGAILQIGSTRYRSWTAERMPSPFDAFAQTHATAGRYGTLQRGDNSPDAIAAVRRHTLDASWVVEQLPYRCVDRFVTAERVQIREQ
jgi:hypothetical protein